jgi:hypothetical protein
VLLNGFCYICVVGWFCGVTEGLAAACFLLLSAAFLLDEDSGLICTLGCTNQSAILVNVPGGGRRG